MEERIDIMALSCKVAPGIYQLDYTGVIHELMKYDHLCKFSHFLGFLMT